MAISACVDNDVGCSSDGTLSCDKTSCFCDSVRYIAGEKCDTCQDEYYDSNGGIGTLSCTSCSCSVTNGAATSKVCDKTTGQCPCKSNVGGRTCSSCATDTDRYGFPTCSECGCNTKGTTGNSGSCTSPMGTCSCETPFTGLKCNTLPCSYDADNCFTDTNSTIDGSTLYECDSGIFWVNTGGFFWGLADASNSTSCLTLGNSTLKDSSGSNKTYCVTCLDENNCTST